MKQNLHPDYEPTASTDFAGSGRVSLSRRSQILVIAAALLALFLGALDALVVGSAMPTIVADFGGLHLYSWVFSSYLLARAISLPIFGKLCDLLNSKRLYIVTIGIFVVSSVFAGAAQSMLQLIVFRALQGIGAGGTFALAYIVISDLSPPEKRGKMMGLISFVWGVASILGPAMGGFIVAYFSWRWIFYINIPMGGVALLGIALFLKETRRKQRKVSIDVLGALTLSTAVLALLGAFLLGGRSYPWVSFEVVSLLALGVVAGVGFYYAEKSAREPILSPDFFLNRGFTTANGSAFFSSFAIFSLSAFSPLFIQGALGNTPAELGVAMVPLTLAWSAGALFCGQLINRKREKFFGVMGSTLLAFSAGLTLTFSHSTPLTFASTVLAISGVGMGFVSVSTLLVVQNSLNAADLGVATSSQQFARTLGGTVGIGVSGSLLTAFFNKTIEPLIHASVAGETSLKGISAKQLQNIESLFQPEVQATLSTALQKTLQDAVGQGVGMVFWGVFAAALLSLLFCCLIPKHRKTPRTPQNSTVKT